MRKCAVCGNDLSPDPDKGFVFCPACGGPHFFGDLASPFEIFGLEKSFAIDTDALETRYYELSRRLHPDRFAASSPALRVKSQELSAALNQAYLTLRAPDPRLDALLRSAGALEAEEKSGSRNEIPEELAEDYFSLQEAVMEDPEAAAEMARGLRAKIEASRSELDERIAGAAASIRWSAPRKNEVDSLLDARRRRSYVRSMLQNLDRLMEQRR